jgi:P4 family phage/plasmid primase-like protien
MSSKHNSHKEVSTKKKSKKASTKDGRKSKSKKTSTKDGNKSREPKDAVDSLVALYAFLTKYKVTEKGGSHTFTDMKFKRTYNVPDEKMDKFFDLYTKAFLDKKDLHLTEKHKEYGPFIVDLDLKVHKSVKARIYNIKDIKKIVKICNKILKKYYKISKKNLRSFVFEKKCPVIRKENACDGIHIMYPLIALPKNIHRIISLEVKKEIIKQELLKRMPLVESMDRVFDMSVIYDNNWLLYGSYKPENHPYKLTHVFEDESGELTEVNLDEYIKDTLPTLLSIRKFKKKECLVLKEEFDTEDLEAKLEELESNKKKKKHLIIKNDDEQDEPKKTNKSKKKKIEESDIDKVKKLVKLFNKERADDYHSWIRVGWALHNIDDSLLSSWIKFSKKSDKFEKGECDKLWKGFRNDGYGIGSIYKWAKDDDPAGYTEFRGNEVHNLLKKHVSGTNYEVAKVMQAMYRYQYICASIKQNDWYEYKEHGWENSEEGCALRRKISEEVVREYHKAAAYYHLQVANSENQGDEEGTHRENGGDKVNMIQKIIDKLNTTKFKDDVMKECRQLFYDPEFYKKLDENQDLIRCKNCVVDLEQGVARQGVPEDYISKSTGIDYIEHDPEDEKFKWVYNFFEQVQPIPRKRNYLWRVLAMCLSGHNPEEKFFIWTGVGCHSRDTLIKLSDGTIKKVQDIMKGDSLLGDDLKPRKVKKLFRGVDALYKVKPVNEEAFIVNQDHMLSLLNVKDNYIVDVTVKDYFKIKNSTEMKDCRLYKIVKDKEGKLERIPSEFNITYHKKDTFYGFKLDKNKRYLDGNNFVHHNSNGKSKVMALIRNAFGEYADALNIALLTQKRKASGNASPEIAKTKGVRFCVFQEPEDEDKLYVGLMKEYTGGDEIEARKLYKEPVKFVPQFHLFLVCNKLPTVPSNDGGTWRRLQALEWESEFVDKPNPKKKYQFKIDRKLSQKLPEHAEAFFSILVHIYLTKYKEKGLKPPAEVTKFTDRYQERSDVFLAFIHENLDVTKDNEDEENMDEEPPMLLYKTFRNWYRNSYGGGKTPNKRDMEDYFEKHGYKVENGVIKGVRIKLGYQNEELDD